MVFEYYNEVTTLACCFSDWMWVAEMLVCPGIYVFRVKEIVD